MALLLFTLVCMTRRQIPQVVREPVKNVLADFAFQAFHNQAHIINMTGIIVYLFGTY